MKRLKDGTIHRYVYYGCCKRWETHCKQPYIREEELLNQLYKMVDKIKIDKLTAIERIKEEINRMQKMITSLGGHTLTAKIAAEIPKIDVYACAKYILKEGTREEKRNLLLGIRSNITFQNGMLIC